MQRLVLVLAVLAAGCAAAPDRPATVAQRVCPPMTAALDVLSAPGALSEEQAVDVRQAAALVNAACAAGDDEPVGRLRDVLPVLRRVVAVAPIDPAEKSAVVIGLAVAEAAIGALR